ncbi:hypothetical protein [Photorhabdus tasmaniensis]|uniref:Uncharacterized protein n=1 Tax=Photorhabdus tasmaniensis TaxID=1004159 RepID=A0ABX0GIK4_9GAMM|nr:hypothetical protein [Photorhabdus tasmaniensis]NHB88997.1 hypothetical protein [Photorhabdus tasmaniensis]
MKEYISALRILSKIGELGAKIILGEKIDEMIISAPKGSLDQSLIHEIKTNKTTILKLIGNQQMIAKTKSEVAENIGKSNHHLKLTLQQRQLLAIRNSSSHDKEYNIARIIELRNNINAEKLASNLVDKLNNIHYAKYFQNDFWKTYLKGANTSLNLIYQINDAPNKEAEYYIATIDNHDRDSIRTLSKMLKVTEYHIYKLCLLYTCSLKMLDFPQNEAHGISHENIYY